MTTDRILKMIMKVRVIVTIVKVKITRVRIYKRIMKVRVMMVMMVMKVLVIETAVKVMMTSEDEDILIHRRKDSLSPAFCVWPALRISSSPQLKMILPLG